MDQEIRYDTDYTGSKNYTQHQVKTANANGFGAAADDYLERGIDLNEQLILNKPATFFLKMNSEAMIEDGIFKGDILIVDRSVKAANDKVIVAIVDGELLVRRLQKTYNNVILVSANKKMANLTLRDFDDRGNVWGVVTCVIHVLEKNLFVTRKSSQFNQKDKYGKEQRFY